MGKIDEIFDKSQFDEILKDNEMVLVDFYASWCGPCKMQAPILSEFMDELIDKVKIIKIDVDQNPDLASQYSILSIPTIILIKNGEQKEKVVGLATKAVLSEMLIKYL